MTVRRERAIFPAMDHGAALEQEAGEGVEVMRSIKRALDPHQIMNPGKVLRT